MQTVVETARKAARAGARVLTSRSSDFGEVRSKGSPTDFVSDADIQAGVAAASTILATDPGARIVIEEPEVFELIGTAPGTLDDSELWIIDPLDGTTSFLHGFPCYSVAVAFATGGRPVAGAVFNVASGEMISAGLGLGVTRDDEPIRCSAARELSDSLLVTGFPYDRGEPLSRQLEILGAFLRSPVHGIRRDGSAAVDMCHVASGRADGFWEFGLKPWDMAAGAIICREAGALVTDAAGAPWDLRSDSVLTANPHLHPKMLEVIRTASAHR